MSVAVAITDDATPALREMALRVTPQRLAADLGPRCQRLVQRNFLALGTNAKGWPSTHFYGRAAQATFWARAASTLDIIINQIGIRQRLLGGPIVPVKAGALTIPAAPEAAGKVASEFSGLEFGMLYDPETGHMRPCLKEARATRVRLGRAGKGGKLGKNVAISSTTGLKAIFWLVKAVQQAANPKVLPSDEQFGEAFDKTVDVLIRRPI